MVIRHESLRRCWVRSRTVAFSLTGASDRATAPRSSVVAQATRAQPSDARRCSVTLTSATGLPSSSFTRPVNEAACPKSTRWAAPLIEIVLGAGIATAVGESEGEAVGEGEAEGEGEAVSVGAAEVSPGDGEGASDEADAVAADRKSVV